MSEINFLSELKRSNAKTALKKSIARKPRSSTHQKQKGKGLRHFAVLICEKLKGKGVSAHNSVADELVNESLESEHCADIAPSEREFRSKHIRRRIYDAINVLTRVGFLQKGKSEIVWNGPPLSFSSTRNANEIEHKTKQVARRRELNREKAERLRDLHCQRELILKLTQLNSCSGERSRDRNRVHVPFIAVHTGADARVNLQVDDKRQRAFFTFSAPFHVMNDLEICKRLQILNAVNGGGDGAAATNFNSVNNVNNNRAFPAPLALSHEEVAPVDSGITFDMPLTEHLTPISFDMGDAVFDMPAL